MVKRKQKHNIAVHLGQIYGIVMTNEQKRKHWNFIFFRQSFDNNNDGLTLDSDTNWTIQAKIPSKISTK